jgi:sugar/nucleoside kinase (ribokinase family)
MKVLGFGDNIIDRFVDRGIFYPGGNCVNFAVFARHLGADAAYLGVFGSDEYGDFLRRSITEEGVSVDHCVTREGASGLTNLRVENGERVFGDWNGGGITVAQPLVLDTELLDYVAGFDLVHSSVYSTSEPQLPRLRPLDVLVSFDLSSEQQYRDADYLDRVCPNADLVLLSASELSTADTDQVLKEVVERGAGMALATRGTSGARAWDGNDFVSGSAVLVRSEEIVDTMGCGDAFLTAFVLAMLRAGWSRSHRPATGEIAGSLTEAAGFAARQCLVSGAFGHGTAFDPDTHDTLFASNVFPSTSHR